MVPDSRWLKFLREQLPQGSRIQLREMKDPYSPVEPGTMGTLDHIDDMGDLHVRWDNGRTLSLIPGEDRFSVLPPAPSLLKLYMPLTGDLFERDEWGDMDESSELGGRELLEHENSILAELMKNRVPEEADRGLMHWYHHMDSVNEKVRSAVFTVEARDGSLWGVAECRVVGTLSAEELDALKEYISGQASDGWGEGFEQRAIQLSRGSELYVHLWNSDSWSIQTEQERFHPELTNGLPELCFTTTPGTGSLVYIKQGVAGCFPAEGGTDDPVKNRQLADYFNRKRGISKAQEDAMMAGSMYGWDCIASDPKNNETPGGMTFG